MTSGLERHRGRRAQLERELRSGEWVPIEGDREAAKAVVEFLRAEPPKVDADLKPSTKWRTDRLILLHELLASMTGLRGVPHAPSDRLRFLLLGLQNHLAVEFDNYRNAGPHDHELLCEYGSHRRRVDAAEQVVTACAELCAAVVTLDLD